MNEFIISFRESLEAALIVGIIFTVLIKQERRNLLPTMWLSVILSVVASVVLGKIMYNVVEHQGNEAVKAMLEGILMYITAGLLFYVIFWMKKNLTSRDAIAKQTTDAAAGGKWGLFLLVFFAILREGFETALFLVASTSIDQSFSYTGFFGGLLLAVLIGYLIVVQGRRIQLKKFFSYTSLLLVVFAAGMIAHGTHELHEYLEYKEHASEGMVISEEEEGEEEEAVYSIFEPKTTDPGSFWYKQQGDQYVHILNDKGSVGSFFKGLFGYNSDPIWAEFILWWVSLIFGLVLWRRMYR